ncbi:MAG: Kae1-associated serine/threonine protein kinase [Candidatus Thermoplasmatota archaeon]|nr:Kae1-associated serine/threonine protein kinase [Candidatus Thermoplasmatota archaeon]
MESEWDEIITKGAEAEVWRGSWRERKVIIKKRVKKGYRHPELDEKIRKMRIRKEARLLTEARNLGVPVPIIYDLDEIETKMVIEYFEGDRVLDCIEDGVDVDLKKIGRFIGRLHDAGITHGDLTTSNILFDRSEKTHCFIDFSLGEKESSKEMMGVDLHLLKEALVSVHDDPLELFEEVMKGYEERCGYHSEVVDWLEKIEDRGRYR